MISPMECSPSHFNNDIVIQIQVLERRNVHKRGLQEPIYSVVIQTDNGQALEVSDGQADLCGVREVVVGEDDLGQLG